MADKVYLRLEDFDGDAQKTSISVADVGDRVDFGTWEAEMLTLRSQLLLWTLGRARTQGYDIVVNSLLPGAAASPVAQGSTQLIIEMQDSLTQAVYIERLPHPDLLKANDASVPPNPAWIASGGLTVANPAHTAYVSLKAAMDASWESPIGNPGTMQRAYIEE